MNLEDIELGAWYATVHGTARALKMTSAVADVGTDAPHRIRMVMLGSREKYRIHPNDVLRAFPAVDGDRFTAELESSGDPRKEAIQRVLDILAPRVNDKRTPIFEWHKGASPSPDALSNLAERLVSAANPSLEKK